MKEVHIGLDRFKKVPCGFAFVEYHHRIDALSAVANLTGTKLDGMLIRVELDAGKSAFVLFYLVLSCVQYEDSVIWLLYLAIFSLHLTAFTPHALTFVTITSLSS